MRDDIYTKKERQVKTCNRRMGAVQMFMAFFGLCLICYLFFIQVVDLKHYRAKAKRQYSHNSIVMRGDIFDRNGIKLATDTVYYDVYARPKDFNDDVHTKEELATMLGPILNIQPAVLLKKLNKSSGNVILLKKGINREQHDAIAKLNLMEIPMDKKTTRVYPQGRLASHVLGYYNHDAGDSGDGTIITAATCTTDGKRYKRCTICKSNYGEVVINKLGHNVSSSYTIDVEPTCTAEGSKSYHCTRCSYKTGDTIIDKIDHSYGSTTYSWSPVSSQYYNACKASRVCSVCSHKQSCKGTVTKKVTTQATCTAEGKATYTATFSNSAFKTKTKEGLVAPLGHKYSVNYKWIGEGTRDYDSCKATKTCTRCGDSSSETAKSVETVEKAPTCAEGGSSRFKVTFTDSDLGSIDESHTTRSTNDHTYTGDNLYLASNSNNTMVVKDKCSVCGNRSYASTFLVFSINENTKVATNGFVGYKQNKGIMLTGLTSNTLQSAGEDGRTYSEYIYRTLGEGYTIYITRNLYNEMGSSQNYIMSGLTKYCICKIID